MDAGVVPVKRLADAKQRLGPRFSPDQRLALARAMLEDALALCRSVDFLSWWVVSPDDEVLEAASSAGLGTIEETEGGLNHALAQAATELIGLGADSLTVIPVDVPLAWAGDIQDLVDTGATSDAVLVPSARDGGTNALYLSPPDLLPPSFGALSFRSHLDQAATMAVRCAILDLPRLALDIDTSDDVDAVLARKHSGRSRTIDLLRALV